MEESEGREGELSPSGGSERARLTEPGATSTRPSPPAVAAALLAVIFFGYVCYLSFQNGIVLFSFHPIFMTVGWLLLISSGLNAFSPPGLFIQWMPIQNRTTRHWVLQTCGLTFVTAGFIIIFVNKIILGKNHFTSYHGTFGLISFILALCTASGGLITMYSVKFKNFIAPIYVKLVHSVIGISTYIFALITMSLPFFSGWWQAEDFAKVLVAALLAYILIWTVLRPTVKTYARIRERINYIRTPN